MKRFAALLSLLAVVGCGTSAAPTTQIPLTEVPQDVMAVARKSLPNVKFDNARKVQVAGQDVLEIRGTLPNGKIREVKVSPSGDVIDLR